MDNYAVGLYLSFRYFQYQKKKNADLNLGPFKAFHDAAINNPALPLFEIPNVDLSEIALSPIYEANWLRSLFVTKVNQMKQFRDNIYQAVKQLNSGMNTNALTRDEFLALYKSLDFLIKKALTLKDVDPNIVKISMEVVILRSYIGANAGLTKEVYGKLAPLFRLVRPDFFLLHKLTDDILFYEPSLVDRPLIDIWDYIAALSSAQGRVKLGDKYLAQANFIKPSNFSEEQAKKHLLAMTSYWFAGSPERQAEIAPAIKIYEKPILDQRWLDSKHSEKLGVINKLGENNELAYFLFNRLNLELVSVEILEAMVKLYNLLAKQQNIFVVLEIIHLIYKDYYLPEFNVNIAQRKSALAQFNSDWDKWFAKDPSINSQERRKKYFTKRLVEDSCPITQQQFFEFDGDLEPIIALHLFEEPTLKLIDEKLASYDLQAYQREEFQRWITRYGTDVLDRNTICDAPEAVTEKLDMNLLRIFLNLRRLLETTLLGVVSVKWFTHKKLSCLCNLDPRLFEAKYLVHIEQLDIDKLDMLDIFYINRYFGVHGSLPIEIKSLRQTAVHDDRCNISKNSINMSLLKLFNKLEEYEPLLTDAAPRPMGSSPISRDCNTSCTIRIFNP